MLGLHRKYGWRCQRVWVVWVWVFLFAVLGVGLVWACGVQFSVVLKNRDKALMEPPRYYVHDLVDGMQQDGLIEEKLPVLAYDEEVLQYQGLSQLQYEQTLKMRLAGAGNEAYALGEGLPEDVRLYIAGAVDLRWDEALNRFEAVLALPQEEAKLRSAWAAFMLGRMYTMAYDQQFAGEDDQEGMVSSETPAQDFKALAVKHYQLVRELVRQGASDTQYLARQSLGDEARLYIWPCRWQEFNEGIDAKCADTLSADDFKQALHLYMAQAVAYHSSGEGEYRYLSQADASLKYMAVIVLKRPDLLAFLLQDEAVRRFLLTYIFYTEGQVYRFRTTLKTFSGNYLHALDEVLVTHPDIDLGREGEMLAILAYRHGRYEQATRFASSSTGAAAAWVRAKLALQRGDEAEAAREYAQAYKVFAENRSYLSHIAVTDEALLYAETGILALARNDYMEAMRLLFMADQVQMQVNERRYLLSERGVGYTNANIWLTSVSDGDRYDYYFDASYIAERVLTTDELKQFVDQHVPASVLTKDRNECEYESDGCWRDSFKIRLRWLLARRLVRDGRYDEALLYFPKPDDPRIRLLNEEVYKGVDLAEVTSRYASELKASKGFWQTDIDRAEHLFNAAVIARRFGMEIMGYELLPDCVIFSGNCYGLTYPVPEGLNQKWVGSEEVKRNEATLASPDRFLHYRYIAIDLAEQAANKVPARSQAFAAILCQACFWEKGSDENKKRLYERYIREGSADIAFSFSKGECEAPDFDEARRKVWKYRLLPLQEYMRVHPIRFRFFVTVAALLLGLLAWFSLRRVMHKLKAAR